MKKDIFDGKIKSQYRQYITSTIFVELIVFLGMGLLLFYFTPKVVDFNMKVTTFILASIFLLLGIFFPIASVFSIRKYPKYKRLRKFLLNSDYYFVGNSEKTHRGSNFGLIGIKNKAAFELATNIADKDVNANSEKYPKKYRVYILLLFVGIILLFLNISLFRWYSNKNISDVQFGLAFLAFAIFEILIIVLLFILAFRIKKIRNDSNNIM